MLQEMTFRLRFASAFAAIFLLSTTAAVGTAYADDDDEEVESYFGAGVRLRQVYIPEALVEMFVADIPAGAKHTGYGLELIRRKGNFELVFGLESESLSLPDGIWIDKGETIPVNDPDWVRFEKFGWITVDVSFVWQEPLIDILAIRYGAGIGLGLIQGEIWRSDYTCSGTTTDTCVTVGTPEFKEDNIPPVFPVINALVGLQLRPIKNLTINAEGGIRTFPYVGVSAALYL